MDPYDRARRQEGVSRGRWLVWLLIAGCGVGMGAVFPAVAADVALGFFGAGYAATVVWWYFLPCAFWSACCLGVLAFHFPDRRAVRFYAPLFYVLFTVGLFWRRGAWPVGRDDVDVLLAVGMVWGIVMPATMLVAVLRRRYLDAHTGVRCLHCGYVLVGNTSGICPECGEAFSCEQFGLTPADLESTNAENVERLMGIRHPRNAHAGLGFQLLFVVLAFYGAAFGTLQTTPPGPRIHGFWWPLVLFAAACSLFTAVRAFGPGSRRQRFRFVQVVAAGMALALAGLVSFRQIETLGTDMWAVPHRRIVLLRERMGFAYGFDRGRPTDGAPKVGDALDPNAPDLGAPVAFTDAGAGSRELRLKAGPYYQRYTDEGDLEKIAYRPTPTWTGHSEVILLYTPRPIMIRKWFRPVPDGWVAFHGDGNCVTYRSAGALRRALEKDNRRRAALGLEPVAFEVHDR